MFLIFASSSIFFRKQSTNIWRKNYSLIDLQKVLIPIFWSSKLNKCLQFFCSFVGDNFSYFPHTTECIWLCVKARFQNSFLPLIRGILFSMGKVKMNASVLVWEGKIRGGEINDHLMPIAIREWSKKWRENVYDKLV